MLEGLFQPMHLLVIFAIALLVFGPKKLPELGKGIGEGIRALKDGMKENSVEHVPFNSWEGLFQSGNTGCNPFPSGATSHNDDVRWLVSRMVKRMRRPSGENRGVNGTPGTVTNSLESVPSALHEYKTDFLT